MDLSFGNVAGFWALLGIPAVVAIHFLQRRSRVLVVTTLFLLEQMRRESETGHRFQRLRTSVPLWLQLLMVLLLTWLLVRPRWLRAESVQRVAIVLDASASMQASRERALDELSAAMGRLSGAARHTEWTVMTTEPEAPALYHGIDRNAAARSARAWEPWLGSHDPEGAFRIARGLVGDGTVLFVTDHVPATASPFNVLTLATGDPRENCGFAGLSVEEVEGQAVFKVLLKNFGVQPQRRRWWIESAGQRSPEATVELAPDQSQTLQGAFPPGEESCRLMIEPDTLEVDDVLPLVRPQPKAMTVHVPSGGAGNPALEEIFRAFPNVHPATDVASADLIAWIYDPLAPGLPDRHACVFSSDPQPGATYLAGSILAEPHPLIDGLNWQTLLLRESLGVPRREDDQVLLWQGERPLISLRTAGTNEQLLCNFDLRTSNVRKLPAFAVLLHRFIDRLRRLKIAPEAANFETNQPLNLAHRTGPDAPVVIMSITPAAALSNSATTAATGAPVLNEVPPSQVALLRAPRIPSHFIVRQGDVVLVRGAARFGDPRESDLRHAGSANELDDHHAALIERHSDADSHWRVWVLAVLAALLASWWFARERRVQPPTAPAGIGTVAD